MKKFYKEVSTSKDEGGVRVLLDDKPIKSPLGEMLILPTVGMADAIAKEWQVDGDEIQPEKMPLTRFANTSFDRVKKQRKLVEDEIVGFADTDLLCYRADHPEELAKMQTKAWDPILEWLQAEFSITPQVTNNILHIEQNSKDIEKIEALVVSMDDFTLSALHSATSILGSVFLAMALQKGRLSVDAAWDASRIDESYQIKHWGEDQEAKNKAQNDYEGLVSAGFFMKLAAISS